MNPSRSHLPFCPAGWGFSVVVCSLFLSHGVVVDSTVLDPEFVLLVPELLFEEVC